MLKVEPGKLPPILMYEEVLIGYLRSPPGVVFKECLIHLGTHEDTPLLISFAHDFQPPDSGIRLFELSTLMVDDADTGVD